MAFQSFSMGTTYEYLCHMYPRSKTLSSYHLIFRLLFLLMVSSSKNLQNVSIRSLERTLRELNNDPGRLLELHWCWKEFEEGNNVTVILKLNRQWTAKPVSYNYIPII